MRLSLRLNFILPQRHRCLDLEPYLNTDLSLHSGWVPYLNWDLETNSDLDFDFGTEPELDLDLNLK